MKKFQAFLGYFIAALMIPLAMVTMIGMGPISAWLVEVTGVKISPVITGGEVQQTMDHGVYETRVHRPVFDALIGERSEGFVQVVWGPAKKLPAALTEDIDYNRDGQADFQVTLHAQSKTVEWQSYSKHALKIEGPYAIGDGLGVRVSLKK